MTVWFLGALKRFGDGVWILRSIAVGVWSEQYCPGAVPERSERLESTPSRPFRSLRNACIAIDWKPSTDPAANVRVAHLSQLHDDIEATGAGPGAQCSSVSEEARNLIAGAIQGLVDCV